VTAQFTAEEIIELTNARLAQGMMPDEVAAVCVDTRLLQEGDWFLALPGKNFDGHDFIGDAYSAGALGCIVEERGSYPIASTSFPLLSVDDTFDAFQQLARNWRRRLNPRVIAVAAGLGERDGVAALCAHVLSGSLRVSFESEGTAQSLLVREIALDEGVQVMIANVSPAELEQVELLGRALAPTIVVLTEDGFFHLRAANENAIARAECNLLAHLEKHRGVGIVSKRSSDLLHRIKYHFPERTILFDAESLKCRSTSGECLELQIDGAEAPFDIATTCSAADAWCVITACRQMGLSDRQIADRLKLPLPTSA
jgi:UDP-N-acetylmuramoyl-tripeptide--D-alanyl-D-alanine ligase